MRYRSIIAMLPCLLAGGCQPPSPTKVIDQHPTEIKRAPVVAGQLPRPSSKVLPWMEVNVPLARTDRFYPTVAGPLGELPMRTYALHGLIAWSRVTDRAIVSTRISQIDNLYPFLMAAKPGDLTLIGGIKTFPWTGDFGNVIGTRTIVAAARRIAELTGQKIVLLENETPLRDFTRGQPIINWTQLPESLAIMRASGLIYLWNLPRILPNSATFPTRQVQTTRLVRAIASDPSNRFLDGTVAWHQPDVAMHIALAAVVGETRLQPRLLVTPSGTMAGRRANTVDEALARIKAFDPQLNEYINIFTGGANWVVIGQSWPIAQVTKESN